MADEPAAALERLDALIGRCKTEGQTIGASPDRIDALDTYERLAGGALLTSSTPGSGTRSSRPPRSSATTPRARAISRTTSAATGRTPTRAGLVEDDGTLVWTMRSKRDPFAGAFDDERNVITRHWDALDDANWWPWMDINHVDQAGELIRPALLPRRPAAGARGQPKRAAPELARRVPAAQGC
jgi:hypothetical protein